MRSDDRQPDAVFSYVLMESRIPQDHPLRAMRTLVDACLGEMSPRFRAALRHPYHERRPSAFRVAGLPGRLALPLEVA
jgi:hypothetical protein